MSMMQKIMEIEPNHSDQQPFSKTVNKVSLLMAVNVATASTKEPNKCNNCCSFTSYELIIFIISILIFGVDIYDDYTTIQAANEYFQQFSCSLSSYNIYIDEFNLEKYGYIMIICTIIGLIFNTINLTILIFETFISCSDKTTSTLKFSHIILEILILLSQDIIVGFTAVDAGIQVGTVTDAWRLSLFMNGLTLFIHSIIGCILFYCDTKQNPDAEFECNTVRCECNGGIYYRMACCFSVVQVLLAIVILFCCLIVNGDVVRANWVLYINNGDYIIYDEGSVFTAVKMNITGNEVRVDCEVTYYDDDGNEDSLGNTDVRATTGEILVELDDKEYEIENGECIDVSYSGFNQLCFGICTMDD